ncbi:MAG: hypothetical protein ABIG42_06200 [bacterium]
MRNSKLFSSKLIKINFTLVIFFLLFLSVFSVRFSYADTCLLDPPVGDKPVVNVSPLQTERATTGAKLTFPVSDDLYESSNSQRNAYRSHLAESIRLYRRVTGAYPESMASFVQSGFPLHWPRNVMTGAPVGVIVGRDFNLDDSDWGLIKWEKFSDDYAKLTFVDLDDKDRRDKGEENWIENYIEFRWRNWESYRQETLEDKRRAFKAGIRTGDDDKEKAIMIGGTTPVNDVLSTENRMIYGMCGQLHTRVCRATQNYYIYEKNFTMPPTFADLYSGFKDKPGFQNEHSLIILENFAGFASLLKTSGADFKIGFDDSKSAQYSWLKIGDETLIAFCRVYNPDNAYGIDHQYLGIAYGRNGENSDPDYSGYRSMADMSSPMITANNLDQIDIPNEITISIVDIPLGD